MTTLNRRTLLSGLGTLCLAGAAVSGVSSSAAAQTAAAVAVLRRVAQGNAERLNREAREGSLKQDRRLSQVLAFSGRGE